MKVYIIIKNWAVDDYAYTGLKQACEEAKVNYIAATRGKRVFETKDKTFIQIRQIEVIRIPRESIQGRDKIKANKQARERGIVISTKTTTQNTGTHYTLNEDEGLPTNFNPD